MGKPAGLAKEQLRALGRLSRVAALEDYYLAGGSAIGYHLRHRRSLDLGFFSLNEDVDLRRIVVEVEGIEAEAAVLSETDAMLKMLVANESVDFVRYRYAPLEPPARGPAGVRIAGLEDLATMKLAAIARRGIRRDFWDLMAILETDLTLHRVGEAYRERFGASESDLYHVARSLTYFEDAEKDPILPRGMTARRWEAIKTFFGREAPGLLRRAGR